MAVYVTDDLERENAKATIINNETVALRSLAAQYPDDVLAQAAVTAQINALEWAFRKIGTCPPVHGGAA